MNKHFLKLAVAAMAIPMALSAAAQSKFNPSQLKGPKSGPMNQVFVLGTPHLSGFPKDFSANNLSLVIEKLVAWKPEIIVIEKLSGAQCDHMQRYKYRYADSIKSYCTDTTEAFRATGLDVPAAVAEVEKTLVHFPRDANPTQRRHLAALFLAAGEAPSALVHWLRLPENERHTGDGLDEALVKLLEKSKLAMNENTQIAVPVAVQLGLDRIYPVDDHTADTAPSNAEDEKEAEKAIMQAWNNKIGTKRRAIEDALKTKMNSAEGVLEMYRAYNHGSMYPLIFGSDFGAAMNETSVKHYGRQYLAYWETRNLRMVSNIRDVMGIAPGKRTLAIVGVSHKPYYESYLDMMHDVKVHYGQAVLLQ
jgi:hypothetical protein